MANALTATGLVTATKAELLANLTTAFQGIYGTDINLDSHSPDGQLLNLFVQVILDVQDLITQVYNTFDPDNAIGVVLDQRVAINGIQRQAGTYTITPITIVTQGALNLYGLDQTAQPVYTIADQSGNNWELVDTVLGVPIGTNIYNFRAALPGAIITTLNTITVQVVVVLGVTSVNNPTTYTTLGIDEESDAALKIRRQKSVSLASQGYLAGLLAALENITNVTAAYVYENDTDSTASNGVPSHSIWCILAGSGAAADIANAIYVKRNAGCGMYGATSYTITQVDGSAFVVKWDAVAYQNLFIAFTATSLNGTVVPNIAGIVEGLPLSFVPTLYQEVNINALATAVQVIDSNTLVTGAGFSTGQIQILTLSGIAASGTFKINYNGNLSAVINWNDSAATIQATLRAVSGLSGVVVTGSIAGQSLTLTLTGNVLALMFVSANSLLTGGAVAITFTYNEGYTNTLTPTTQQYQFVVAQANIIVLVMKLSPATLTLVHTTGTQTFVGAGGYGTLVYSISVNNSGGSINASTGAYTAGATPSVDTILVTDSFGNTASATVTVI